MEDPAELRVRTTLTLAGARVQALRSMATKARIELASPQFRLVHLSPVRQFPSGAILSDAREQAIRTAMSRQTALISWRWTIRRS